MSARPTGVTPPLPQQRRDYATPTLRPPTPRTVDLPTVSREDRRRPSAANLDRAQNRRESDRGPTRREPDRDLHRKTRAVKALALARGSPQASHRLTGCVALRRNPRTRPCRRPSGTPGSPLFRTPRGVGHPSQRRTVQRSRSTPGSRIAGKKRGRTSPDIRPRAPPACTSPAPVPIRPAPLGACHRRVHGRYRRKPCQLAAASFSSLNGAQFECAAPRETAVP